jgi:NAD(P)-dependent dehydrogenase (short-subunit alcohol dehydrogenase family)
MAFAERGAQVCLVARSAARLEAVRWELLARGLDAWVQVSDITDMNAVAATVDAVLAEFGRLDTVIDFAAHTGPLDCATWEVTPEDWRAVLSTNLDGVYHVLRACMPPLLQRGEGRLLLASSPFGDVVTPGMGAYPASRAGSNALFRQAAAELHGTGVAAAIVHPGITETEGLADFRRARAAGDVFANSMPSAVMANLFVWAALQPAPQINGEVLAWSDPAVRTAAMMLPPG